MSMMKFLLMTKDGAQEKEINYDQVFAIGYAGRNMEKTMEHIRELEEQLGVPAPKKIPTIFQCGTYLLTQEKDLHFIGEKTCGEVEYVMVVTGGKLYIGLGSDHTDRELEGMSVPKAKQICAKPIGTILWDYEEIKEHWETIKLYSYQTVDGEEILYQQGTLADIMDPGMILKELDERVGNVTDAVIYSGTVPLTEGFRYGTEFRCEMDDEVLGRKLSLNYKVITVSEEER